MQHRRPPSILAAGLLVLALAPTARGRELGRYAATFARALEAQESGRLDQARAEFATCAALAPESPIPRFYLACAAALEGDSDAALAELEQACALGYADASVAEWAPELASLRGTEAFARALEHMRANATARPEGRALTLHASRAVGDRYAPSSGDFEIALGGDVLELVERRSAETVAVLPLHSRTRAVHLSIDAAARQLVAWNDAGTAWVFSLDAPELRCSIPGESGPIRAASISADGAALLVGRTRGPAELWSIPAGRVVLRLGANPDVHVELSDDGTRAWIAGLSRNRVAELWDLERGEVLRSLVPPERGWTRCGFIAEGSLAWCAAESALSLAVLDARDGRALEVGHALGAQLADWTRHDPVLVSEAERVLLVDLAPRATGDEGRALAGEQSGLASRGLFPTVFLPSRVLREAPGGAVVSLDLLRGSETQVYTRAHGESWPLATTPDGTGLFSCSEDGVVRYREVATGKVAWEVSSSETGERASVCVRPDGELCLIHGPTVRPALRRVRDGGLVAHLDDLAGGAVCAAAWSVDGELLATGETVGVIRLRDGATGEPTGRIFRHGAPVLGIGIARSKNRLVTTARGATAKLWELASGELVAELDHSDLVWLDDEIGHVELDPKGERLLTTTYSRFAVRCWDARDGALLWERDLRGGRGHPVYAHFIASGERVIATLWSGDDLVVLSAEDGVELLNLSHLPAHDLVESVDGRYLAAGRNPLYVYDARRLVPLYTRADLDTGEFLIADAGGHFAGDASAWSRGWLVDERRALRLDAAASLFLDPVRVRAAVAGVPVRAEPLSPPPVLEQLELVREPGSAEVVVLLARASHAEGIAGFELELDGEPLAEATVGAATVLGVRAEAATLELALPLATEAVRVRARSRAGILGPARTLHRADALVRER